MFIKFQVGASEENLILVNLDNISYISVEFNADEEYDELVIKGPDEEEASSWVLEAEEAEKIKEQLKMIGV